MCGIAGILLPGPVDAEPLRARVRSMADRMTARGPDADGVWIDPVAGVGLSFRRLAILDRSPLGNQPMTSPAGRYVLVFNGEIYNEGLLRRRLESDGVRFAGHSDTEVLAAALDAWGVARTIPELDGMFAIAVWDRQLRQLHLIRDRIGIKPLLWRRLPRGGISFASGTGALAADPEGGALRVDPDGVLLYLRYLFVPGERTAIADVSRVSPGEHLLFRPDTPDPALRRRYWSLGRLPSGPGLRGPEAIEVIGALLRAAVRRQLRADVPVGVFLSGGVDSATLLATLRSEASGSIRAYTVGFGDGGDDETVAAAAVARYLDCEPVSLQMSHAEALALVPRLGALMEEPVGNPSSLPGILLSRLARTEVGVALSGDGADELFMGYRRYGWREGLPGFLLRSPPAGRRALAVLLDRWGDRGGGEGGGAQARKLAQVLRQPTAPREYAALLATGGIDGGSAALPDPLLGALEANWTGAGWNAVRRTDLSFYLPDDLLLKVDRTSMAESLEVRVPYLDHALVEAAWRLAPEEMRSGGVGKRVLRSVAAGSLPERFLRQRKLGFTVPIAEWLRGPLGQWARERTLDPWVPDGIRPDSVLPLWRRFDAGLERDALLLWGIAHLRDWERSLGVAS